MKRGTNNSPFNAWSLQQEDILVSLDAEGLSAEIIGVRLGRSKKAVKTRLQEIRKRAEAGEDRNGRPKLRVRDHGYLQRCREISHKAHALVREAREGWPKVTTTPAEAFGTKRFDNLPFSARVRLGEGISVTIIPGRLPRFPTSSVVGCAAALCEMVP